MVLSIAKTIEDFMMIAMGRILKTRLDELISLEPGVVAFYAGRYSFLTWPSKQTQNHRT